MTSKNLRFIFDHTLKQKLAGIKRSEDGIGKTRISRERKELSR